MQKKYRIFPEFVFVAMANNIDAFAIF